MDFELTDKVLELRARVDQFMEANVFPYELEWYEWVENHDNAWQYPPWFEGLKAKAREAGIWNWFLPKDYEEFSPGLSNLEFAPVMERMCRVPWAQEVFNCSAPDRGNMEVLARFGSPEQQERWLKPLLAGEIRSAFSMTEPAVASSDATNLETTIVRDGDEYVINGRKWFTSNAFNPLCKLLVVMGKTDPNAARHQQFSTILVPLGHARRHARATRAGVRQHPLAGWSRPSPVRERARARGESRAGRRPRLRDRAGPARSRALPIRDDVCRHGDPLP